MQRWTLAAWIAPPVLALVATAQLPGIVPVPGSSVLAGGPPLDWTDPVAMTPCRTSLISRTTGGAGEARVADGPAGGGAVAWRISPILDDGGALAGWNLVTAAPGTRPAALRLPAASAVRGPVDDLLAVAEDDGTASALSLISPALGCRQVVGRDPEVARQAVWIPSLNGLAVHSVRRADRSDAGTWILPADGSAPGGRLIAPLDDGSPAGSGIGRVWTTELVLSSGGDLLAVQSCGERTCSTRIVPIGGGPVIGPSGAEEGPIVGLDESHLITMGVCPGRPCSLVATRLNGSGRRALEDHVTSATTTTAAGRMVVMASVLEDGGPQLVAFDPADGRRQRLGALPPWLLLLRSGGDPGSGASAAPGALPAVDGEGRPYVLDAGRAVLRDGAEAAQ